RQRWALRVVQKNPTPETIDCLRRRLESGESQAASEGKWTVGPTEQGYMESTRDLYFDEVLLTYFSLGGQLNETESTRLRFFGYLGEPKERLEALLAKDQQSKK